MYITSLNEWGNQSKTWTSITGRRSPSKRKNNIPVYNLEGYVGWWQTIKKKQKCKVAF
jgi:hypothetical protein